MSIVNLIPKLHTHSYAPIRTLRPNNHSHAPRFRVHNPLSIKPVSHPPVSPQQSPPYPLLSDKALYRLFRSNLPLTETPSSRCLFYTLRSALPHTRVPSPPRSPHPSLRHSTPRPASATAYFSKLWPPASPLPSSTHVRNAAPRAT